MKLAYAFLSTLLVFGLSACGQSASVDGLKSTIGMSKDQVESKFGKPESSNLEATDSHPGGYWVYKVSSGASCKLHFDLPPRVVSVDC